jgi:hypothetical protein
MAKRIPLLHRVDPKTRAADFRAATRFAALFAWPRQVPVENRPLRLVGARGGAMSFLGAGGLASSQWDAGSVYDFAWPGFTKPPAMYPGGFGKVSIIQAKAVRRERLRAVPKLNNPSSNIAQVAGSGIPPGALPMPFEKLKL